MVFVWVDGCLRFPAEAGIPCRRFHTAALRIRGGSPRLSLDSSLRPNDSGVSRYALRNAGDVMKARLGMMMLAMAEVRRAVSLVVKWAMAPPMVQPMGIMPMTMV